MKLEPIVKKYYDALAEGRLIGRKCKACGAVEFPPHPACNTCGTLETEWCELSGKGEIVDFVLPGTMGARPMLEQLGTYVYGTVRLAEGPTFKCVIFGVGADNAEEVRASLPLPVHPRIEPMDGYSTLYFELD